MTISMSDILCVTNRSLCKDNFLRRVEQIAQAHPAGIILREKDLSEQEYKCLAQTVIEVCERNHVPCMLHTFVDAALVLQHHAIHLPMSVLRQMTDLQKGQFTCLGASCHSVEEAREAERLGCTYITVGHIFETNCKRGLPGRGLEFLSAVCQSVSIPVYAIGGINKENFVDVRNAGATGACIMSGLMQCENVAHYLENTREMGERRGI